MYVILDVEDADDTNGVQEPRVCNGAPFGLLRPQTSSTSHRYLII